MQSLYNNRKDASIVLVSIAVIVALALFVFGSPPPSEDERRDQRDQSDGREEREEDDEKEAGFSSLAPLYLGFSEPQTAQSENIIYVVWNDFTNENTEDVYFKLSLDAGNAFSPTENLSNIQGNSTDPQIATYGNSTYVVWQDDSDGNDEIYFKISPAGKSGFGRIFNLSRNEGNSTDPQIATYGNSTYVVWQDDTNGNDEIYFKISPAGKSGFGRIFNLSKNEGNSTDPQIATYGNSTYVVWQDDSDGNDEIFLKISPAGKSGFGKIFNLSNNEGNSTDPQIATYGNSTYVVWQDNSNDRDEIHSARLTSEGPDLIS